MSSEVPSQTVLLAGLGDHLPFGGIVQGIFRETHAALQVPIRTIFKLNEDFLSYKPDKNERNIHVDFSVQEGSCIITVTPGIESELIDGVREALEKQLGLQHVEEVQGGGY